MSIAAASDLDGQPAGLRIGDLGPGQLASLLQRGRLALQTGPLLSRLQTGLGDVAHYVGRAYRHHPCVIDAEVVKEDNVFPMIPAGAAYKDMLIERPRTKMAKPTGST